MGCRTKKKVRKVQFGAVIKFYSRLLALSIAG